MDKLYLKGAVGEDVKEIQAALNFHVRRPACPLVPDGIFGPLTDARVREFQKKADLWEDGIVGPNTCGKLYRRMRGSVQLDLTQIATAESTAPNKLGLLPKRAAPASDPTGPVVGPAPPPVAPPPPPVDKPVKTEIKSAKSTGFHIESKIFYDATFAKKNKHALRLTLMQDIPWPIILPKPAKLKFEVAHSPFDHTYNLDGKIEVPFTEIILPVFLMFPDAKLKPYFFTGAGRNQDGFTNPSAGVGAALNVKLLEKPHIRALPTISLFADGGYKAEFLLDEDKFKGKGFFKGGMMFNWHFF